MSKTMELNNVLLKIQRNYTILKAFKEYRGFPKNSLQFPPRRLTGKNLSVSLRQKTARIAQEIPKSSVTPRELYKKVPK